MDVALIDEHDVVRSGLEAWLASELPQVQVRGSFAGPDGFLGWLPATGGIDALVTEIQQDGRAPDMDVLRRLCESGPPVIIYSHLSSDEVILAAIEAGATSYVSKAEGKDHLIKAVGSLAGDESPYVGPRMAEALRRGRSGRRICLSEREKQVLVAWFQTESKDEVGRLLHIAPATVRTHLQRIRAKYAHVARPASTKSALLARAIEDGIIGLSDLSGNGHSGVRTAEMVSG